MPDAGNTPKHPGSHHASSTTSSTSRRSLFREPAFEKHHVLGLKVVRDMKESDKKIHVQLNRVLQKDFSVMGGDALLQLIHTCDDPCAYGDWLTDYIQPTPMAALMLNISAELVTHYTVPMVDLQTKSLAIYEAFLADFPGNKHAFEKQITDRVHAELEKKSELIIQMATEACKKRNHGQLDKLPAFIQLAQLKVGKELSNSIVGAHVNQWILSHHKKVHLIKKPLYPMGTNADISILGAPGSGKSSILTHLIKKKDLVHYVSLATDDYRGVYLPTGRGLETIETEQGFTRTQDAAYLIKELVQTRMEKMTLQRPNMILDCVTLEGWERQLLQPSIQQTTSVVACMGHLQHIPERAHHRALTATSPNDAGRHVNTAVLIKDHAQGSRQLLMSLPFGVKTILYDTARPKGASLPPQIGTVDTTKQTILCVYDIEKMGDFLGKIQANPSARRQSDLYKRSTAKAHDATTRYNFTHDAFSKATELLNVSISPRHQAPPLIQFADPNTHQPYLSISHEEDFIFKVAPGQAAQFKAAVETSAILQSMLIQAYCANTEKDARKEIFILGKESVLKQAIMHFEGEAPPLRPCR